MHQETRSQYIERTLEALLKSSETSTKIDLYGEEIRRFSKRYADKLLITQGPKTNASAEDKRYNCTILKL